MSQTYKIKLQNFEGPLDLLLFFVRKDELNIYDIPISRITKSYLEYLQLMTDLNLDIASEFILMAATLMRIKAKSMLPPDPTEEEEEEMMDPREELSRRLIEYRQFKEASKTLSELDEYWRTVYRRTYFNFDLLPKNEEEAIGLKDISFFDLLTAYKKAMEKKPKPFFHRVERLNVTIEQQTQYIMDFFRDRNCYLFTELCEAMDKIEIVVTFLALLDLVKKGEIAIRQASIFDDIWIYKASEFQDDESPELQSHEVIADETNVASVATTEEIIHPQREEILSQVIDTQADIDNIESETSAEQVESVQDISADGETISNEFTAEEIPESVIEIKGIDEPVTDAVEPIQQEVSEPEDHSTVEETVSETGNNINQSFEKVEEERSTEEHDESDDADENQKRKEEEDEIKEEENRVIASYFPEIKSVESDDVKVDESKIETMSENVADVEYEAESEIEKIENDHESKHEIIEPMSEIENQEKYQANDITEVSDSSEWQAEEVTQSNADSGDGESETKTQEQAALTISNSDESNQTTIETTNAESHRIEEIKMEETPTIQDSPIKSFFKKIVSFVKRIFSK
ncbi:segregation/condensation protein A [bacterium]|nr:segregation/condensation protein A [bacterium]